MPMMIALKRFHYSRRDIQPGETFEASEKDAKVFLALKRAKAIAGSPIDKGPVKAFPDEPEGFKPAAPMTTADVPTPSPRRGRYARRDLRSE